MHTVLIIVGANLIWLALLLLAALIAHAILRLIPSGRVKRFLTRPSRPNTSSGRTDTIPGWLHAVLLLLPWAFIGLIWWSVQ